MTKTLSMNKKLLRFVILKLRKDWDAIDKAEAKMESFCSYCGGHYDDLRFQLSNLNIDSKTRSEADIYDCTCSTCENCGTFINDEVDPDNFRMITKTDDKWPDHTWIDVYCSDCYEDEAEPLIIQKDVNPQYFSKVPAISVKKMKERGYKLMNNCSPAFGSTDYRSIGWRVSGDGVSDGRSLGLDELAKSASALMGRKKEIYATLTEAGQFQVYIGLFIKK